MNLVLLGMSHKTAPVEVRDAAAFSQESASEALLQLHNCDQISECMIVSTCNRTEIIAVFSSGEDVFSGSETGAGFLLDFWSRWHSINAMELRQHTYVHTNKEAVEHVFRVCAGLDSMVLGETQIVSQTKDAFRLCCSLECNGPLLNRLLHRAFGVSKRIRHSTNISQGSMSVSFVACDLAKRALGGLDGKCAILVGAGEMGQLTARNLVERGIGNIVIASRTAERAQTTADRFGGRAVPMTKLVESMSEADVVVTATSATSYVVTREMVERARDMHRKALVIIDLGVPRDVDPAAGDVAGVRLHNIDDLHEVVETHHSQRLAELSDCDEIIRDEVGEFVDWHRSYRASPVISELMAHFERMRSTEVGPLKESLSNDDFAAVDRVTRSMLQKMLRHPIVHLVDAAKKEDPARDMQAVCCVLGLHGES